MINKTEKYARPVSLWLTRCFIAFLTATCLQAAAQTPLWSEEFDTGSIPDSSVWSYDTGDGGWGNREYQNYTSNTNNVKVEGGNLIITAERTSATTFTSGRIKTQDNLTFKYGTVEARIKTPDLANGLWPAFWTLGTNYPPWPECGEIDIMEMGNKDAISLGIVNRRVGSHAHWGSIVDGGWPNYGDELDYSTEINDTFVIYRMEWTPYSITTKINGQKIWSMNISNIEEFNKPHFFILNMAVGGRYTGIYGTGNQGDITALPNTGDTAEYVIDYIRIFDNGFTVMGGSAAPNIPPKFTDDPIVRPNALEGTGYIRTIAGSATDVDAGDTLTYSMVPESGPAWLNVSANGVIAGLPSNDDVGPNSWTVLVDDGNGGTDTAILNITVDNLNDLPEFTDDPIIMPNALEGTGYIRTIAGSATDVDAGDTLTYSKVPESGPAWLNVSANGVIAGLPANGDVGPNSWTILVDDGNGGTDTAILNITVDSAMPAAPPVLSIQISGSNLEILWPVSTTGFSLYGSTNLTPPVSWSSVTNAVINQGADWMVTIPIVEAPQFFQLQQSP